MATKTICVGLPAERVGLRAVREQREEQHELYLRCSTSRPGRTTQCHLAVRTRCSSSLRGRGACPFSLRLVLTSGLLPSSGRRFGDGLSRAYEHEGTRRAKPAVSSIWTLHVHNTVSGVQSGLSWKRRPKRHEPRARLRGCASARNRVPMHPPARLLEMGRN